MARSTQGHNHPSQKEFRPDRALFETDGYDLESISPSCAQSGDLRIVFEDQQHGASVMTVFTEPCAVCEFKVGRALSDQGMIAVVREVVALPHPGNFSGKGLGSEGAAGQIGEERSKSKVATLGTHQCNQCFSPLKSPSADGVALRGVRIQKCFGRPTLHRCGEFPAEVEGISQ